MAEWRKTTDAPPPIDVPILAYWHGRDYALIRRTGDLIDGTTRERIRDAYEFIESSISSEPPDYWMLLPDPPEEI